LSSLRARLACALLLIFLLALGASTALDVLTGRGQGRESSSEPFQDGLVLLSFTVPALILIWAVSNWTLRPLARASQEARQVGPSDPEARISRAGLPGEIVPLVDAMNGALDRLSAAYETQRRLTADAAHELRTPLSVLQLRLQRARLTGQTDWPALEQDCTRMTRLVEQLLDLARKEQAGRGDERMAQMNLCRAAREAAAMIIPLAEAEGRAVVVDLPETLTVAGRHDDLRDMVRNLLHNALAHGQGTVTLAGRIEPGLAIIEVSDKGPGVAPAMQEAVFERFQKVSQSSPGTGLGLAIVREVVRSHQGTVGFVPGTPSTMRVVLPAR
jgi:two-component system sensor histidine kinase QseC